jgi:hypothetical protein
MSSEEYDNPESTYEDEESEEEVIIVKTKKKEEEIPAKKYTSKEMDNFIIEMKEKDRLKREKELMEPPHNDDNPLFFQ